MHKKLIAEAFGTFTLALVVQLSLFSALPIIGTPLAAALVLTLAVYTLGSRSGCHINPAITIGLWSIKKIGNKDAVSYIVAQLLGAALAAVFVSTLHDAALAFDIAPESSTTFLAEVMGALLFGIGVAAVVSGKVSDNMSGVVIGGSLLLGIIIAAEIGSAGILNPAVAFALGTPSLSYLLGSTLGAVIGMQAYRRFIA